MRLPDRQATEIGIGGHDDSIICGGAREDNFVGRVLDTQFADMDGVMPAIAQGSGDDGRESVVDEKPHGTVSGNSRSLTASAANRSASRISS